MKTKFERLVAAFTKGAELTAKQISHRFDIRDPDSMLYRVRNEGYELVRERRVNSKGEAKSFYRINMPKSKRRRAA
jgi:hypothetical protein